MILLRHGESTANAVGLFTGLIDVPLSEGGKAEARYAAGLIADAGYDVSYTFCSEQQRAVQTAEVFLELGISRADAVARDWRLDERNYGGLTGRLKSEVAEEYGHEQFLEWRRSVDVPPPPMSDELLAEFRASKPYCFLPPEAVTPTESLRDVEIRVASFHRERVVPRLIAGETVLVIAHGNSLRGYCADVDALGDAEIRNLNIPTGHPLIYRMDAGGRPLVRGGEYLDEAKARKAAEQLRRVGGT